MKVLILFIIKLYQLLVSPFLAALFPTAGCRRYPTCSAYMYQSIERRGVFKGLSMGASRILRCNPWS